jgi:hypothetical protein
MKKIINFTSTGESVSDFKISEWVDNMLYSDRIEFNISTHLVIDEIRARIKEGRIKLEDIEILIQGEVFPVDKDGRSSMWYPVQEVQDNILNRLLGF